MNPALYRKRQWANRIGLTLSMLAMALGLFVLLWILAVLFKNGFSALDLNLFTQSTPAPGTDGGGLLNAIVGSALMVGFTALISTPVGIFAGVYLAEYGDQSRTASVTRFVTDIMLSAPSIVCLSCTSGKTLTFSLCCVDFSLCCCSSPVVVKGATQLDRLSVLLDTRPHLRAALALYLLLLHVLALL